MLEKEINHKKVLLENRKSYYQFDKLWLSLLVRAIRLFPKKLPTQAIRKKI